MPAGVLGPIAKLGHCKPQGNQTEVTVTVTGEKDFMTKAFCLFKNMDKMVGGKFETALVELKTIAESPTR